MIILALLIDILVLGIIAAIVDLDLRVYFFDMAIGVNFGMLIVQFSYIFISQVFLKSTFGEFLFKYKVHYGNNKFYKMLARSLLWGFFPVSLFLWFFLRANFIDILFKISVKKRNSL
jgi:hypothetical protein